jgi:hypothetical protein
VLAKLRPLSSVQRALVIAEIVADDRWERGHRSRFSSVRPLAAAVRRDGVM